MKNIFIFDMDGTLTPSRREMTKDFEDFYSYWAENHTFFLVSGSNLEKIKEQVPEYILNLLPTGHAFQAKPNSPSFQPSLSGLQFLNILVGSLHDTRPGRPE